MEAIGQARSCNRALVSRRSPVCLAGAALWAIVLSAALLTGALGTAIARAAEHPAQAIVEEAVNEAIAVIKDRKEELLANPDLLASEIERIIVPHVDFNTVTKLAVGKFWRQASSEQKTELVAQFKALLMNTYAGALEQYQGQNIAFEPFRPERRDDRAVVRSKFVQSGASADVPVLYKLREKDGWMIYDIEVNSISLVTSYRTAFANEISRGGIDGLLDTLKQRNAKKS